MIITDKQKLEIYGDLLSKFTNKTVSKIVRDIITETPTIFFGMSVSASGKYHPKETNGLMGLVKHSIAVLMTTEELMANTVIMSTLGFSDLNELDKEIILAAALLHDNAKYGPDEYDYNNTGKIWTRGDHPILVDKIAENAGLHKLTGDDREILDRIIKIIESHMGEWNTYRDSNWKSHKMPVPETPEQVLVHLADYQVSRKTLDDISQFSLPEDISPETVDWFNIQNS